MPTIDHRKTLCTAAQALLGRSPCTAAVAPRSSSPPRSLAAAPLLTACGSDAHPGAAAVVGGERITVSQLESRVEEVREAQRAAVPDEAQYQQAIARTGSLTRDTLHGMVLDRVLERAARDAGVTVTDRDIQQMRSGLEQQAGGAEALEAAWLQQYGIAAAASGGEPPPPAPGPEARPAARYVTPAGQARSGRRCPRPARNSTSTSTRVTATGTWRRAAGWTRRPRGCRT